MEIQEFVAEWQKASNLVIGSAESGVDLSDLDRTKAILWVTKDQALAAGPEELAELSTPILVGFQSALTPEDVVRLTLRFESVYVAVDRVKSWEALQTITGNVRFSGFESLRRIVLVQIVRLLESSEERKNIPRSELELITRAILATGELEQNFDQTIAQNTQQRVVETSQKSNSETSETLPDSYIAKRYILSKIPNELKCFLKRLPGPVKTRLLKYWSKI